MEYNTYILAIQAYEAMSDEASNQLKELKGNEAGPMGLTPNHIKFTPEYQTALKKHDAYYAAIRQLNKSVPKEFLRRRAKERRENK